MASNENLTTLLGQMKDFPTISVPEPVHDGLTIIQKTPTHKYDKDAASATSRERNTLDVNMRVSGGDYDDCDLR